MEIRALHFHNEIRLGSSFLKSKQQEHLPIWTTGLSWAGHELYAWKRKHIMKVTPWASLNKSPECLSGDRCATLLWKTQSEENHSSQNWINLTQGPRALPHSKELPNAKIYPVQTSSPSWTGLPVRNKGVWAAGGTAKGSLGCVVLQH